MRLILHVGTHKTGTTTLQHALHGLREPLAQRRLIYPERQYRGGKKIWREHNWIAKTMTGAYPDTPEEVSGLLDQARATAGGDGTILLSAEDMCSCCDGMTLWEGLDRPDYRTLQRRYLERVAGLMRGFDVEAVMVFRRADEFAQSLYQTLVRSNKHRGDFRTFLDYAAPMFDYAAQQGAFAQVFGPVRMLSFHDLIPDIPGNFLARIGAPMEIGAMPVQRASTDARLSCWMAEMFRTHPYTSKLSKLLRDFSDSDAARTLFPDFGRASFWHSGDEREAFHERAARGFPDGFFPPAVNHAGIHAELDDAGMARVSRAYEAWRRQQFPAPQKQPAWWNRLLGSRR